MGPRSDDGSSDQPFKSRCNQSATRESVAAPLVVKVSRLREAEAGRQSSVNDTYISRPSR